MVIGFSDEEGLLAWWHLWSVQLAEQGIGNLDTDPSSQDNCQQVIQRFALGLPHKVKGAWTSTHKQGRI